MNMTEVREHIQCFNLVIFWALNMVSVQLHAAGVCAYRLKVLKEQKHILVSLLLRFWGVFFFICCPLVLFWELLLHCTVFIVTTSNALLL